MRYVINQQIKHSKVKARPLVASFVALAMTVLALGPTANAVALTDFVVTPSDSQGWVFNGDPTNATPYEFNEDQASTGEGSLYVEPIGAVGAHKFIAGKPLGIAAASLDSISYDFLIAGDGVNSDAKHFYLNVYTQLAGSTVFYNCRFDYVPTTGSTANFTTATFAATDTATNVGDRAGDSFTCPPTLAGMPAGSTISHITLNVGDTSTSDEGLAGYLDNVVISTVDEIATYDFEADPTVLPNKEACKNGGWVESEAPVFKNQGDCVSHFASAGRR